MSVSTLARLRQAEKKKKKGLKLKRPGAKKDEKKISLKLLKGLIGGGVGGGQDHADSSEGDDSPKLPLARPR